MENINIWTILGIVSVVLLAAYFKPRNSVWGGFTAGIIIGVIIAMFFDFSWYVIGKSAVVGTFLGFGADLLGRLSDKIRKGRKRDFLEELADPNNEVNKAMKWLEDKPELQAEFNQILKKHDLYGGPIKAQEWLVEKYNKRNISD